MMLKLIHRAICFLLKAGVVTVTGFSMFQSALAPALDVVKNSAWEKALAALPGVGDAADGVIRLVIGSAVLIKNSVGILLFLLLIALCITPMLRMFITTFVIKFAAALMSVVGERRITLCTDHAAEAGLLLLQTLGTALLFFFISFSAIVLAVGRTW